MPKPTVTFGDRDRDEDHAYIPILLSDNDEFIEDEVGELWIKYDGRSIVGVELEWFDDRLERHCHFELGQVTLADVKRQARAYVLSAHARMDKPRERALEPKEQQMVESRDGVHSFPTAVAGWQHRRRAARRIREGDVVTATREPQNRHDRSAIKLFARGRHVGYLPAKRAAWVAPILDAGGSFRAVARVRSEGYYLDVVVEEAGGFPPQPRAAPRFRQFGRVFNATSRWCIRCLARVWALTKPLRVWLNDWARENPTITIAIVLGALAVPIAVTLILLVFG